MIYTTLNAIRSHSPCEDGWQKLLAGLGKTKADNEPLPFSKIVKINGLDDALWATRCAPEYNKEWRLFSVWCAREASQYSDDWRVLYAIQIAERYAHGMASREQLRDARDAAGAATWAAWDAALCYTSGYHEFAAERIETPHTHGTGCTYSAAITAELAKGVPLVDAVLSAKRFVTEAIATNPGLGSGKGPLNHFA